ncbi:MAG: type transporter [Acidobacteria bacterium]|nr:type transporter [Acidobacteriota bacterium]
MNFRRTRAMARKEFLHILRDPRSLIMALILPFLMILLFGYALTLDVDRIPTLIYDQSGTIESRTLIARFEGSRYFQILGSVDNYKTIEHSINKDQCMLGVVIPRDYSRQLLSGNKAEVQLILDGSDSNTASIASGYANALIQIHNFQIRSDAQNHKGGGNLRAPVESRTRIWYNSELKSRNYVVPGLIAFIMMIIASLLTSLTIAREWEIGAMEQLLSTPLRPAEIVLGKMAAFFSLGITDMIITVAAGVIIFRVPMRGSYVFLVVTSCIFLIGALCWGILLSASSRTQTIAFQLGMLTSFLPAFILSGFIFAIENMPAPIQVITYFFPTRYFMTIVKSIFLRGVGIQVLGLEVLLLVAYASLVFFVATRRLRLKVA